MAEMAGLALGAISLGVEVCKSLMTYADAVSSHTSDLQALSRRAQTLLSTLELLTSTVVSLSSPAAPTLSASTAPLLIAIAKSTESCHEDFKAVQQFIEKLVGCAVSDPGFHDRCNNGLKALKYGFQSTKRAELEQRITKSTRFFFSRCRILICNNLGFVTFRSRSSDLLHSDMSMAHTHAMIEVKEQAAMLAAEMSSIDKISSSIRVDNAAILGKVDNLQAEAAIITAHISDSTATILESFNTLSAQLESMALVPRRRYSRAAVQKQDTEHVATARIRLFGTVVNAALQLCFSATRGAGGFSISPWIAFHAVVDEKISPAFRLASLFDHIERHNCKDREDMTARKMVSEAVLMQFLKLYMTGRESPSDVNIRGENVMHLLATDVAAVSIKTFALLHYTTHFPLITLNRYRSAPVPYPWATSYMSSNTSFEFPWVTWTLMARK